ncbi:MAG: NOL1/NOP2/sun family putative RNA methylase [Ignavibacteriaceae bacterium]|nr:NOL1/NOP2/sun family putative RNA methylase [Ignavibacteriaceae bacterium]
MQSISFSENIENYIEENLGSEFLKRYKEYYMSDGVQYLRLSSLIEDKYRIIKNLAAQDVILEQVPGIENAFVVKDENKIAGKTLEFILGKYYLQSLSSMLPPLVLDPKPDEKILDLCAAPGSKTTQIAELMNNRGTLYANEISADRLQSLVFNIDKMSLINTGVLKSKGEELSKNFSNYFDKILVDAPCSALGILQKRGEVSNWWNIQKVEKIVDTQMRLLVSAVKMLKEGGEIVYSTCTLTLEENEYMLHRFMKNYPVELVQFDLPVKSMNGLTKYHGEELNRELTKTHRIVPWEINSEGFFVSKLRKIGETESKKKDSFSKSKNRLINWKNREINSYLVKLADYYGIELDVFEQYNYLMGRDDIYFINSEWESDDLDLFVRVGAKFGSVIKNNILQLNSLASQVIGKYATKNIIDLDDKSMIDIYLKGGVIKRLAGTPGQIIVKYNGYIVGCGVFTGEGLKSQFPRPFRTQEIVI